METNILTPKALFQKDIKYTVPAFQRRYVWTHEEQWEPLWEDVCNTAEDYLEQLDKANGKGVDAEQNTASHFLGAVVVQQVSTATKDVERRKIIDGQQRVTTLQLLLDAVQYVCKEYRIKGVTPRLLKLVTNDEDLVENKDDVLKLLPTISDREAFKHAMDDGLPIDDYENSLIVQAHEYFQLQTKQWLGSDTDMIQARAEALETAITGKLQMVVIDLEPGDDPHVIFETLNARGTPLLESDLIKNYVISETKQTDEDGFWGDLDDDWWRENLKQGRLYRPRIDALLDYWLETRTLQEVPASRVFNVFREIASNQKIENVMSEVLTDLSNYRRYEEGMRKPIEEVFHYRSGVMQMGAFAPVLLTLLSKPEEARFGALQALESYLVRRMVCRDSTRGYNLLTLDLVRELKKFEPEDANKAVVQFLSGQKADSSLRWPTDKDLEHAFATLPLYRLLTRGRLRLVLEGIEEKYRESSHAEQTLVPKNLTIEHILPQTWQTHWPLSAISNELEVHQNRNQLLHTIGNLTLVTGKLNSVVSNAPWEEKCKTLEKHSILHLNHNLLAEYRNVTWDEKTIQARSKEMAALVADVWPGPYATAWEGTSNC